MEKKLNIIIGLLVLLLVVMLFNTISARFGLTGLSSEAKMKSCGQGYGLGPCGAQNPY